MSKLVITLRDTTKKYSNFYLVWNVRNDPLSKMWKKNFIRNFIKSDHPLEKTYCLQGWNTSWHSNYERNLSYLCNKLNEYIANINEEMPSHGYPFIDLNFTVDALKSNAQQELMNKLHHHFEVLIGQVWSVSEWYKLPLKNKTRYSIRMLNNYCHEIESSIKSIENRKLGILLSLNGIDKKGKHFENKFSAEMREKEYLCLVDDLPFGSISLYYAQLGKSHYEVFVDNDTDIDRENISGIKYVTGEGRISFYSSSGDLKNPAYVEWLNQNNWDINDHTLSLKNGIVADLDYSCSKQHIINEISKRNDVYQIAIDNQIKTYNYTWKDQESWEQQI